MINLITAFVNSSWIDFYIWVAITLALLWLLRKTELVSKIKPNLEIKLRKVIPLADAVGIIFIALMAGNIILRNQPDNWIVITIVVLVFILWLLRGALLDITSGIILRFENGFGPGDKIDVGEGNGTISKVSLRCLDITLDKGKQVSIPYSRLSTISLLKPSSTRPVKSVFFELEVPKSAGIADIKSGLELEIMTQPWSVPAVKPAIELLEELPERFRFKIMIHALELEHLAEIERTLRGKYITAG